MSALRLSSPGQPTRYIDLGPQSAHLAAKAFSVQADTIPAMRPILSASGNTMAYVSTGAPTAYSVHVSNRIVRPPVCGEPLYHKGRGRNRLTGENCAAAKGHLDTHRSRRAMDAAAERRRGSGRQS